ncbi:hypothetical protein SAMN05443252_103506 [Bacillus sp. OV322]|uniref:DUF4176 domain-containing protein n=1 Tax=Bacillus sp. OV322 TaxID=1882764 RepID=UPI0008EAE56F|nr:DUF4176 domain-containing protein [Bacillus sp. OV322]SFC46044.1 hypothetical protein SAMN05443252_103506 [Bacillus sp. OV322]
MAKDFNSLEIEIGEELLPIGSVVETEIVPQALMIYGRKQQKADKKTVWDYVACPYPQGHIGEETNVFLNHSQIGRAVFKGLETEGEKALRQQLNALFNKSR